MARLEKTLSFPVILIITINSIIGTGIFFLPAVGAKVAGPASLISWTLLAFIGAGIALVFAELVGMYPKAGGVYEYSKQAFGYFPSFLIGWMTMIAGNVTVAMLVVTAVNYLNPDLPGFLSISISIGFILIFNYLAYRGMQTSAAMLVAFGLITIGSLVALTIPGIFTFSSDLLKPFWVFDLPITLLAIFFIAEQFFGWESATFLAEETKDAERVMPRAMWVAAALISLLVLSFVVVSLGNIPWNVFGSSATPLIDLATLYYGVSVAPIAGIIVYLAVIGTVASWIVSAPRLIMSLAEDKLFIAQFADTHPQYKTPHKAILFQTILSSFLVIVGSGNIDAILHLLMPIVLVLYMAVIIAFLVMRRTKPEQPRPFRLRAGVPLGVLLIATLLALLVGWSVMVPGAIHTLLLVGGFLLLSFPLFLLLSFYYDPGTVIRFTETFAFLSLLLENLLLPKRIRREILSLFRELEQKRVLEYGAGVGTFTLHIAERVGPRGTVIATDLSAKNLSILDRRLRRRGITHVSTLHDPHQVNRIHPSITEVDLIFSVGMLSYIQDLRKVLKDLHRVLPERGKVCFVEYVDFFRLLPNPKFLADEEILKRLFRDEGFSVQAVKVRGLFWNYLFIYGEKSRHARNVPFI